MSYQYCYYLYYHKIHLCIFIYWYCTLIHYNYVILSFLYSSISRNFAFLKFLNLFLCDIFEPYILQQKINPQCSNFLSSITLCYNWKMEHYWGSADHCEEDSESGIYYLGSVNLCQCSTLPIYCEQLHWTLTWRLLYLDRWSTFKKRPGRDKSITC